MSNYLHFIYQTWLKIIKIMINKCLPVDYSLHQIYPFQISSQQTPTQSQHAAPNKQWQRPLFQVVPEPRTNHRNSSKGIFF
jgi:hypothetical protein